MKHLTAKFIKWFLHFYYNCNKYIYYKFSSYVSEKNKGIWVKHYFFNALLYGSIVSQEFTVEL